MSNSILVGYSSIYGSTQEVAEEITKTLRSEGFSVDLLPARKVQSLDGYQAVILGAPLYMFHWHKDALNFISRHHKVLQNMPVMIFALGPFHDKEEELQGSRSQLDKELAKFPWLKPAAVEVFVGKFDPQGLRFPHSLIGPLKQTPASDERDWDAIHTWASSLANHILVNQL